MSCGKGLSGKAIAMGYRRMGCTGWSISWNGQSVVKFDTKLCMKLAGCGTLCITLEVETFILSKALHQINSSAVEEELGTRDWLYKILDD